MIRSTWRYLVIILIAIWGLIKAIWGMVAGLIIIAILIRLIILLKLKQ